MSEAIMDSMVALFVVSLAGYGSASFAWAKLPDYHKRIKLFLVVFTVLLIVFTVMTISMFYQYSKLGL